MIRIMVCSPPRTGPLRPSGEGGACAVVATQQPPPNASTSMAGAHGLKTLTRPSLSLVHAHVTARRTPVNKEKYLGKLEVTGMRPDPRVKVFMPANAGHPGPQGDGIWFRFRADDIVCATAPGLHANRAARRL